MAFVKIQRIVDNLGKHTKFLQPIYEAITNSLEADATEITVNIFHDDPMVGVVTPKIKGFTIIDNGVGFTKEHQDSFCELWTDKKIALGCKGSGRYTWLSVYNQIDVESKLKTENEIVKIPFSVNFKDSDISRQTANFKIVNNETKIVFSRITNKFTDSSEIEDADLQKIYNKVLDFLLVKLFLMKKENKQFKIKLIIDNVEKVIDNNQIPELSLAEFSMINDFVQHGDKNIYFQLYYHFLNDGNSKQLYYCANNRVVKNDENDGLGFHAPFEDNASLNLLLCSKYLDDRCNDTRDDFPILAGKRQRNIDAPILMSDIKGRVKDEMHKIIRERYKNIDELNRQAEEKAINAKPYLTEFIKQNTDIVKTEKSLLDYAHKKFNDQKEKVQDEFAKLLADKGIDTRSLLDSVKKISVIAMAELGEYILYRNEIIKALESAIGDASKNEEFIHNIVMQKGSISSQHDSNKYALSNLWLLDDKFMTYSNAMSDVRIERIKNIIANGGDTSESTAGTNNRPDLCIFFSKAENDTSDKDLIMVELKGAMASKQEKKKAITELPDNIDIVRRNTGTNVSSIWSYIITSVDEDLENTLRVQGYKKLYSQNENKLFYIYNENITAHIFVLDLKTIVCDAFARNQTFLEILKKQ